MQLRYYSSNHVGFHKGTDEDDDDEELQFNYCLRVQVITGEQ